MFNKIFVKTSHRNRLFQSKVITSSCVTLSVYVRYMITLWVKLLFLFGCAKYIRIKMSFIWPMHVLEFRSSVPLCTLVYKRV